MSSRPTPHASRDKGLSNTSTHPNIQYNGLPSVATLASRRIRATESKHPAFQLHTTCPDLPNVPVSLSGSTVFEDELNAIMAESWSAPTYSYAGTDEDLMAGLDDTRQEKSNPDHQQLRRNDVSHIDQKPHFENVGSRLQEFFNDTPGSAPWTPNNLRQPGIVCSFCGSIFTGIDRLRHIATHVQQRHSTSSLHITTPRISSIRHDRVTWRDQYSGKYHESFHAIGTWAREYTENFALRMSNLSGKPPRNKAPQLPIIIHEDVPVPHAQAVFILRSLDPNLNPRRANNFFNGLDIVLANLQNRFPDDAGVKGMRCALTQLENLYDLNYDNASFTAHEDETQERPTGNERSCAGGQQEYNTPTSSSGLAGQSGHDGSPAGCSTNCSLNVDPSNGRNQNRVSKNRKTQNRSKAKTVNRKFACHIRQHNQAHDRALTCVFSGADNMWGICQHLHGAQHKQELPFLARCKICKEITTNYADYESLHGNGICRPSPQARGAKAAGSWLKLYDQMFPRCDRITSPYVDDQNYTLKETGTITQPVDPLHMDNNDLLISDQTTHVQSFLEGFSQGPPYPTTPNLQVISPPPVTQDNVRTGWIWLGEVLGQRMLRPHDLNDHYMGRIVRDHPFLTQDELDAVCDGFRRSIHSQPTDTDTLAGYVHPTQTSLEMQQDNTPEVLPENGAWLGQFPVPQELEFGQYPNEALTMQPSHIFDERKEAETFNLEEFVHSDRSFYPAFDSEQLPSGEFGMSFGELMRPELAT